MDPSTDVSVVVRRWRAEGWERLELPDGKGWRLPRRDEIGLRLTVDGSAYALDDWDPQRMHRWVPMR